jgi:hypothetical protein
MSAAEKIARARGMRIEDELARRGIHLRGKNERFGPCPKCGGDDRFSINVAKQVFNCRGCEIGGDVIDLVRHLDGVDFTSACAMLVGDPSPKAKSNGSTANVAEPRKVRASNWFPYVDEAGAALFVVRRMEYQNPDGSFVLKDGKRKKTFEQARPDPNKHGALIFNVNGVRVVPYRLPELLEAIGSGHPVFVVEGEHKADMLAQWNLTATCNAGGAGKWKSEHAAFLRGADVVLLPDNDARGREHVQKVAESLKGIASRIRIVTLPDLPEKDDIVDWIKAGHTREELDALVEAAADWQADAATEEPRKNEDGLCEWDFGEDTTTPPPREWLLGTTFCRTFLSSLLAAGGVGKTAVRYTQFLALASGRNLTGEHVHRRCRVLVISLEDDDKEARRRILAVMKYHGITHADIKGWLFVSAPGRSAGTLLEADPATRRTKVGELAAKIEAAIQRRQIDIVSLDPFVKSHSAEENSNTVIDEVAQILTDLGAKYNVAVDAPHHVSKGAADPGNADKGRGASGWSMPPDWSKL